MRVAIIALLAGCGPKVIAKAPPEPDLAFYGGTEPVLVGTPIQAMVMWDASCERPAIGVEGGYNGERPSRPCDAVPHTFEVHCENDACSMKQDPQYDYAYTVTPTKTGLIKGTITVKEKHGKRQKSFPISIESVAPDALSATCTNMGNTNLIDVEVTYHGAPVELSAPALRANGTECTSNALVPDGESSSPMSQFSYTCNQAATKVKLALATPAFQLETEVPCVANGSR